MLNSLAGQMILIHDQHRTIMILNSIPGVQRKTKKPS